MDRAPRDAGDAIGTERIRAIKRACSDHPLVAIGGIHTGNISEVIQAGADAVAVVSAVVCAANMQAATEELMNAWRKAVPLHLRDSHYPGGRAMGHGKGYLYRYDFPG